jgi:site-specific recombinase XerD
MQDFINYLEIKNLSKSTQKAYLRNVNLFLDWYQQDIINCTKKDIITYLEYLRSKKNQQNITRRNALIAVNHYFSFLEIETTIINPTSLLKIRGTHKNTLYHIFTADELKTIIDNYYHTFIRNYCDNHIPENQKKQSYLSKQRNYVMLAMLLYQGLSTNELQHITITDLDLNKAKITIKANKKTNARTLNLNASQIGILINYVQNIRHQFFNFCTETDKLFFTLPESCKQQSVNGNLMHAIKPLTKHIKSIEKSFLNFKQIRASVITQWLKTDGLRKAQYYAGHKYISSTEKYLPNNLEGLIDDISKYNPF